LGGDLDILHLASNLETNAVIAKDLTLIRMAIKRCTAVWLGRKQEGHPVRAPLPYSTLIGRLGVIYDSQPAGIHKNTNTQKHYHKQVEALSFLIKELPKTSFFKKI
jgi:hypothetical protein